DAAYARAADLAPYAGRVHLARADLHLKLGDFPKARAALHRGLRLAPGDARATMASVEELWRRYEPVRPMSYTFLDENLDALYQTEARLATAVGAFAALALVVACLGLFGLATFTIQRRTREIGVRKVLGASVPGLVRLLARDFVVLVAVAFVVAAPVAWFGLHAWLDSFAYRVPLSAAPLLAAGVLA
ncbi:MAG: FtsX-like permease family protein, partial [Bacteroidota bacterium]